MSGSENVFEVPTSQEEIQILEGQINTICIERKKLLDQCMHIKDEIWGSMHTLKKELEPIDHALVNTRRQIVNILRDFDQATEMYARGSCRPFCDLLYRKIPREIRESIYDHLNFQHRIIMVAHEKLWSVGFDVQNFDYLSGHFSNEEFVGPFMRREIIENWYAASSFEFSDRIDCIERFLKEDRSGLGLVPRDVVRTVDLTITRAHLFGREYELAPHTDDELCSKLLHNLEPLLDMQHRLTQIRMAFNLRPSTWWIGFSQNENLRIIRQTLEVTFPLLKRMHEAGLRINAIMDRFPGPSIELSPQTDGVGFSVDGWMHELHARQLC